jgi:hypothetical protein
LCPTKLANTELTPPTICPIAKSLTNRDGPRAPIAIHGLLGLNYHPVDKADAIADCLENQFTPHDLCEENHERQVEARVQALLEAVIRTAYIDWAQLPTLLPKESNLRNGLINKILNYG